MTSIPQTIHLAWLIMHLLLGIGVGTIFFLGLWHTLARPRAAWLIALSSLGRLALLSFVLMLVSREGSAPLLLSGLGILCARAVIVQRIRVVSQ